MKYSVLYNPLAGQGKGKETAQAFAEKTNSPVFDMTQISDYGEFFADKADSAAVICGGDGTLNRFINDTEGVNIPSKLLFLSVGTGNDFLRDIEISSPIEPVDITEYVKGLPTVTVNGKTSRFINGVGFGIDGYCCEVGDEKKVSSPGKKVNYTAIAIKGLLFFHKPSNATVKVDGREYKFKKVWIAPTMKGRYYGGGMMPTPAQDRNSGNLSFMAFHSSSKLKTLMIFPSIFKGEHIKEDKYVKVIEGREISVTFDTPTPLQIDGETVKNILTYTVKA